MTREEAKAKILEDFKSIISCVSMSAWIAGFPDEFEDVENELDSIIRELADEEKITIYTFDNPEEEYLVEVLFPAGTKLVKPLK